MPAKKRKPVKKGPEYKVIEDNTLITVDREEKFLNKWSRYGWTLHSIRGNRYVFEKFNKQT